MKQKNNSSPDKFLRVNRLSHKFGIDYILENVSFRINKGESFALVGPSGCGKTTILNYIARIYDPYYGTIENTFNRMGVMFQEPRLLPWKNARDNLELGLKAMNVPKSIRREKSDAMAEHLRLSISDLDKFPHQLSGGMQSRISLGRCLVVDPDLILLDEPFSSLDIGLKTELYQELLEFISENTALVLVTHDLMEAIRLSDKILLMDKEPGRIFKTIQVEGDRRFRTEHEIYHLTGHLIEDPGVRRIFQLPKAYTKSTNQKEIIL